MAFLSELEHLTNAIDLVLGAITLDQVTGLHLLVDHLLDIQVHHKIGVDGEDTDRIGLFKVASIATDMVFHQLVHQVMIKDTFLFEFNSSVLEFHLTLIASLDLSLELMTRATVVPVVRKDAFSWQVNFLLRCIGALSLRKVDVEIDFFTILSEGSHPFVVAIDTCSLQLALFQTLACQSGIIFECCL